MILGSYLKEVREIRKKSQRDFAPISPKRIAEIEANIGKSVTQKEIEIIEKVLDIQIRNLGEREGGYVNAGRENIAPETQRTLRMATRT